MLSTIFAKFGMGIINSFLDKGLEAFKAYENKQISMEQLRDTLFGIMVQSVRDIEVANAEALTKTYASFMGAVEKSLVLQVVWAMVTVSQLFVILWHEVGIPALVYVTGLPYPSSGPTSGWAYALVGGCVGLGPTVLRSGPGGSLVDKFRGMVGK
jgi:hypothetical protein